MSIGPLKGVTVSVCIYLSTSRYGKPGCDAETCDYFLSYRRIGTDVEYEMSADTDGWVAVGFSSDKKMVSSCTNYSDCLDTHVCMFRSKILLLFVASLDIRLGN